MEAPLLEESAPLDGEPVGDYPEVNGLDVAWRLFLKESRRLWVIALPIIFQLLCFSCINSVTLIFVGRIGNVELAAVSISISVIYTFCYAIQYGMASALETLSGQAFGAGQVHIVGLYLQRSWVILIACGIILSPMYVFAGRILQLIGQETDIAVLAGRFCKLIIPRLFAMPLYLAAQRLLIGQRKVRMLAWIALAALIVHVLFTWLLVSVLGWGLTGAAVALDISDWFTAVAQTAYFFVRCKDAWTGFSMKAFNDMWAFVRLSVASGVMFCLDIWYLMLLVLLTGYQRNATIAVDSISICMNVNNWETLFFVGIGLAIGVRVANELGSGHPRTVKFAVTNVILTSVMIGLMFMAVVLTVRKYIARIFSNSEEVQHEVAHLGYLLAVTMVLNSAQLVILGVAIGSGWQASIAFINLGCYYIFGLPLGIVLGFTLHLGVQGIWGGLLCGTALQTIILSVMVWRTDWNKEVVAASARVSAWGGKQKDSNT